MNLFSVIAEYDRIVRANESADFPTRRNVATCRDGWFGAWGEIVDLCREMVGPDEEALEVLADLFEAYQASLRFELGIGQT